VARFAAGFNFCRVHGTYGLAPAQVAGITGHQWTVDELHNFKLSIN